MSLPHIRASLGAAISLSLQSTNSGGEYMSKDSILPRQLVGKKTLKAYIYKVGPSHGLACLLRFANTSARCTNSPAPLRWDSNERLGSIAPWAHLVGSGGLEGLSIMIPVTVRTIQSTLFLAIHTVHKVLHARLQQTELLQSCCKHQDCPRTMWPGHVLKHCDTARSSKATCSNISE